MEKIQPGFMEGVFYMWNKTLEQLKKNEKYNLTTGEQEDFINGVGMAIRDQYEELTVEQYDQIFDVEQNMGIHIHEVGVTYE